MAKDPQLVDPPEINPEDPPDLEENEDAESTEESPEETPAAEVEEASPSEQEEEVDEDGEEQAEESASPLMGEPLMGEVEGENPALTKGPLPPPNPSTPQSVRVKRIADSQK